MSPKAGEMLPLMREALTPIFGPIRPPIGATEPFLYEKNKTLFRQGKWTENVVLLVDERYQLGASTV